MSMTSFVLGEASGFAWGDPLFMLFSFLLLMFLLKKFAFGPLMAIMKEREEHVKNQIDSAEKSRQETSLLLDEQRNIMKQSRQEALANIEESRKQGEKEREQIILTARKEVERLNEAAKREIEQEKEQAIKALKEQTSELSLAIATKVLERELTNKDQQKLISDLLREAGEKNE